MPSGQGMQNLPCIAHCEWTKEAQAKIPRRTGRKTVQLLRKNPTLQVIQMKSAKISQWPPGIAMFEFDDTSQFHLLLFSSDP